MMEKITIEFVVDTNSLNEYLGNTPNVTLEKAMMEFLERMHEEYVDRDIWSSGYQKTGIKASYKVVPNVSHAEVE